MPEIKSTEEPVVRFAKLSAELYYFMADTLLAHLGKEKGTAAIRGSLKKFAEKRVCDMKTEAAERGLPPIPQTYFQVRDMPADGWEHEPENPLVITECPMFDLWKSFGEKGMNLGALYCEIDHTLFGGFGMELCRPRCKTNGNCVCDFQLTKKEEKTNNGNE